jgi:outer membrane protein TolC
MAWHFFYLELTKKLNYMVSTRWWIIFFISLTASWLVGQNNDINQLSLEKAYQLLERRYPALKDGKTIETLFYKEQDKLDKDRLPTLSWRADGRLQTENASLDLPPGTPIPLDIDLPLYTIRTYVDAQYTILDGGFNEAQKKVKHAQFNVDLQQIEVNKYQLRERINQLFINIAILREQEKLFEISLEDLATRKESIRAAVEEGIILESELSKLSVKELEILAQEDNIRYQLVGLIHTLEELLDIELNNDVQLNFPSLSTAISDYPIDRPEQKLFQLQEKALLVNSELIDAGRKPKLGAFAQAGVGYPNPLNFLDNSTAPFGLVGLQFNWKITDWKKDKLDKEILSLQAQRIQHAKSTFEFNLQTREAHFIATIDRLQKQIEREQEIAKLQKDILQQLAIQLDEGVITSADYLLQVNAELKSRQNILIHQTELLKAQVEFWNERGGTR